MIRCIAAQVARDAYNKAESKVQKLENKIKELTDKLGRDYGDHKEFLSLDENCYEYKHNQYTYEMCPYKGAAQKEGHSSTSLGNWAGIEWKENQEIDVSTGNEITVKTRVFKFTNGQTCWQGPARSLTVDVVCGDESRAISVDEPAKCVYHMIFQTPAACDENELTRLQKKLESLKKEHEQN